MMHDYGFYARFLDYVYHYLNGKINYMIPAGYYMIGDRTNPGDFGSALGYRIKINLPNILDYSDLVNNTSVDKIKGLILGAVAHELSHLDQDIQYINMDNKEYKEFIERTNDANALIYIKNNYDQLQYDFNYFDMDLICKINYTAPAYYFPYYKRVEHGYDKILSMISSIINKDLPNILQTRGISNLFVIFRALDGSYTSSMLMKNNIWIPTMESMKFLTDIMQRFVDVNICLDFYDKYRLMKIELTQLEDNRLTDAICKDR